MNTISFGDIIMKDKGAIKHSKIKNTGILFELLTRKLTSDIINGVEQSTAKELIERYFGSKTELGRECMLYQTLIKQKFQSEVKAQSFIDEVLNAHAKINKSELRKAKYNLIKEIKQAYAMDDFFKNKIDDYKLLASVYKLFQSKAINTTCSPLDAVESKFTILEHITAKAPDEVAISNSEKVVKEYEKENKELRLLAYKIMTERFNEKYKVLNASQRNLVKEYINNISSANSLKDYILKELVSVKSTLKKLVEGIPADNKVSQIKVKEVLNQLETINDNTQITDNHVMGMLNVYELIGELIKLTPEASKAPVATAPPTK